MGSFDFGVARLIEMIEERFGRLAGNVFLIIVVLAILSISIYTIGRFAVVPMSDGVQEFGALSWQDLRAILIGIGVAVPLAAAGGAGVLIVLAMIVRRMARRREGDALVEQIKALQRQAEATEKETEAISAKSNLLQTFLNHVIKQRERNRTLSDSLIRIADTLEEQEAIEPEKAEEIRESARKIAEVGKPRPIPQVSAAVADRLSSPTPSPELAIDPTPNEHTDEDAEETREHEPGEQ